MILANVCHRDNKCLDNWDPQISESFVFKHIVRNCFCYSIPNWLCCGIAWPASSHLPPLALSRDPLTSFQIIPPTWGRGRQAGSGQRVSARTLHGAPTPRAYLWQLKWLNCVCVGGGGAQLWGASRSKTDRIHARIQGGGAHKILLPNYSEARAKRALPPPGGQEGLGPPPYKILDPPMELKAWPKSESERKKGERLAARALDL